MDIAKLSINLSEVKTAQNANVSMLKKAIEMTEQQGVQIEKMMDDMAKIIDVKV